MTSADMRRTGGAVTKGLSPLFLLALLGPLACGPSPEPVTPAPKPAETSKPGGAVVAAPGPTPLPQVSEPSSVVGTIRWRSPAATMNATAECSRVPVQVFDAGLKVGIDELMRDALRGLADTKGMAALVATDAPVDAVIALDDSKKPRAVGAVAIGLTSLEGAKRAVESVGPLKEIAPGVWRIGKDRRDTACAIATSVGATPARLVCGEREKDLVALAPYMARSLPNAPVPAADVHGEARWAPLDARFGNELKQVLRGLPVMVKAELATGDDRIDATIVAAATGLGDEVLALMSDLDKLSFDAGISPSSCVTTADAALSFRGRSSWLAGTIFDRPERQGPPPAIFWRVPKDSDSAFFARGSDPARYARIVTTLRTVLDAAMAKAKVGSAADRKALTELIALPLGKDTNSVQASGHVDAKVGGKPSSQGNFDNLVNGTVGWYMLGVDEGPEAMTKLVKDVVAVYNRAGLSAPIKKEMREDAKLLPTVRTVGAPKELGKGSLAVEIKVTEIPDPADPPSFDPKKKKAQKKVSLTLHLLLMADGKTTWLAFGANKDELVKRLVAVKTGAPDAGTLAARPGLEGLKTGKVMAAGFFTLVPIVKAMTTSMGFASSMGPMPPEATQIMGILNNLPNKGETPILASSRVTVGSSSRTELEIALPKGSVEDLAKVGAAVAQMANGARSQVAGP